MLGSVEGQDLCNAVITCVMQLSFLIVILFTSSTYSDINSAYLFSIFYSSLVWITPLLLFKVEWWNAFFAIPASVLTHCRFQLSFFLGILLGSDQILTSFMVPAIPEIPLYSEQRKLEEFHMEEPGLLEERVGGKFPTKSWSNNCLSVVWSWLLNYYYFGYMYYWTTLEHNKKMHKATDFYQVCIKEVKLMYLCKQIICLLNWPLANA